MLQKASQSVASRSGAITMKEEDDKKKKKDKKDMTPEEKEKMAL